MCALGQRWVCAHVKVCMKYAHAAVYVGRDLTRLVCIYAHVALMCMHLRVWSLGVRSIPDTPGWVRVSPEECMWLRLHVSECVSELGASVEMCGNVNKPLEVEVEGF